MCCLFLWTDCVKIGKKERGKKWRDRVSGEEINIMSDISKSNMHESTMPPMAQQTNSRIKERPGGKLQERSKSYFIIKTKRRESGRLEWKKEVVSFFLLSPFLLQDSWLLPPLFLPSASSTSSSFPSFSCDTPRSKALLWARALMSARQKVRGGWAQLC